MEYIEVHIQKPLPDGMCYIRDKFIFEARKQHKLLKITTPKVECLVEPDDWMMNAKTMDKVFLNPDRPMRLYGNYPSKFSDDVKDLGEQGKLF